MVLEPSYPAARAKRGPTGLKAAPAERPRVLFVDDDPRALELFCAQVGNEFQVVTAASGAEGLERLDKEGPFPIVVSDQRMVGMTGVAFLWRVRERDPDSVRILLTAYPDLTTAVAAVNDGYIFRFLVKPCPQPTLLQSLRAAWSQHQLITAQKVLLEQTLRASVKALVDILAFTSPVAFGRTNQVGEHVRRLLDQLQPPDRWEVEVAASLSQLGYVALPPETALKVYQAQRLTPEEEQLVARVPEVAEQIIAEIPRLDGVRRILRYQHKRFDGSGPPRERVRGKNLPWGSRVLKIAQDFEALQAEGLDPQMALDTMRGRKLWYDPTLLKAFAETLGAAQQMEAVQEVQLSEVVPGMVFAEDVRTRAGAMLIARGTQVSPSLAERIKNLARAGGVMEPVRVLATRA